MVFGVNLIKWFLKLTAKKLLVTVMLTLLMTVAAVQAPLPAKSFATVPPTNTIVDQSGVDIVVIQSEAFMDITKIKEMSFSKAPLNYFKKWQKLSQYGEMRVPVNGGMTCNSEFELLTGVRQDAIAYNPYVTLIAPKDDKVNSLPWLLKANGYATTAIHPYERTYFNRDLVYPKLGIDQFVSIEGIKNPKKIGYWISDKTSFDLVSAQLGKSAKNQFIFNVTVQNHAPFTYKSANDLIKITSKAIINDLERTSLQNYATGLYYTDQSLNAFLEQIKKRSKRTIVIFYGDHQPAKTHKSFANMAFFKSKGYYITDYLIYDNKDQIKKGRKDLSLIQLRYEIEDMALLTTDSALGIFNRKEGLLQYDTMDRSLMKQFYEEENFKLNE